MRVQRLVVVLKVYQENSKTLYNKILYTVNNIVWPMTKVIEAKINSFALTKNVHGLHVMIGTAFLAVGLWRVLAYHSTENHHLGLESGILYWHFVDVVWIFLFISIYYWGS